LDNTDDQLVELRAFWEEYGRSIVVGVVLAVITIGSWNFWERYQTQKAEEASTIYYSMVESYQELERIIAQEKQQAASSEEDVQKKSEKLSTLSKFQETVASLKEQYANTEYAHYASLQNAKYFVGQNELEAAENELRDVLKHSPNKNIELLTQLRLARELFAAEKLAEALKLTTVKAGDRYRSAFQALAGDRYCKKGDRKLAEKG